MDVLKRCFTSPRRVCGDLRGGRVARAPALAGRGAGWTAGRAQRWRGAGPARGAATHPRASCSGRVAGRHRRLPSGSERVPAPPPELSATGWRPVTGGRRGDRGRALFADRLAGRDDHVRARRVDLARVGIAGPPRRRTCLTRGQAAIVVACAGADLKPRRPLDAAASVPVGLARSCAAASRGRPPRGMRSRTRRGWPIGREGATGWCGAPRGRARSMGGR
jgi:hypothetical protein